MALNSSGQISLGGSTLGESVALELGLSATNTISLNDTAVRNLASISTGAISMNDLRGKSRIGQAFGGGFFAGQISTAGNGIADYNLVIAPVASGESIKRWKTISTLTSGTSSVIDGPTNSANMNNATHPAAQFCEGLTIGGFSDWYMPAKNELEVCYYNLKPTTTENITPSGTNTNAVPSRGSNYTSGTPAQTSATDFKSGGTEAFATSFYWSSTSYSASFAWSQTFFNGTQYYYSVKTGYGRVRAVRRVAV